MSSVEQVVRDWLLKAGCGEISTDFLLDHLEKEWIEKYKAGRKDDHLHSFDMSAMDQDYCQVSGCRTMYWEYLEGL